MQSFADTMLPRVAAFAPAATPARLSAAPLTLRVLTSIDEFYGLESAWRGLDARAGTGPQIFQRFDWLANWAEHYLRAETGVRPHIVVGISEGRPVVIWPLVARRFAGLTILSWMGFPASQYGDVLVENGPDRSHWLSQSWSCVIGDSGADALVLRKVRADSAVAGLLERQRVLAHSPLQAPFVDLSVFSDADSFAGSMSAKERRERKRQRKLLAAAGNVDFQILRAGPEAQRVIVEALSFKKAWLKRRGFASAAFADDHMTGFFASVAGSPSADAGVRVSVLTVGGATAAAEIGFQNKGRHIAHVGAFNPDFERFGVGSLQCEDTIRRCIGDGLDCYDLLAPADRYKTSMTGRFTEVASYAHGMTLTGRLYAELLRQGLRRFAKESFASLPASIRNRVTPFLGSGMAVSGELPMLMAFV